MPDNDEPGRKHSKQVADTLADTAEDVRVVELPRLPPKGDVSDWLDAGGTLEELESLVDEGPPELKRSDIRNAPDPPIPVFANGMFPRTVSLLLGESGLGKSFFAQGSAASLATGLPMFRSMAPREAGGVMYLSFEDMPAVIKDRIERISGAMHSPAVWTAIESGTLEFFCEETEPLLSQGRAGDPVLPTAAFQALENTIRSHGPALVIIDPLSGAVALANENDNAALGVVAQRLHELAARHNVAILLVHHTSKGLATTATQHSARGASALACRARWIGQLLNEGDDDRPGLSLHVVKRSYGAPVKPIPLERQPTGVLTEIWEEDRTPTALVEDVVAWFKKNPEPKVTLKGIGKRHGDGKLLADALVKQYVWARPKVVQSAANLALKEGFLELAEDKMPSGHKREVIRVVE